MHSHNRTERVYVSNLNRFSATVLSYSAAMTRLFIWTPPASYIRYTPPEPDRGCCYGASYAADDLLEHVREALRGGDDLAARCALHTLRGLAEVVLAKLSGELLQ
jgi:hypothetical protein